MRRSIDVTVLCVSLVFLGSIQAPSTAQSFQPREQVAAEFAAICEREQTHSEFFGRGLREQLDQQLSPKRNTLGDFKVLVDLAYDAVRLGEFDRAHLAIVTAQQIAEAENLDPASWANALRLEAMAHFLAAEDANCLAFNNAASCILPIRPEAVHQQREPIESAIKALKRWLDYEPNNPEPRWLLNLAHMLAGTYPNGVPKEVRIASSGSPVSDTRQGSSAQRLQRFVNAAPALGIDGRDLAGGALMDDFNGDGFLDLLSSSWDPCSSLRGFRSDGAGNFVDVTQEWGLDVQLGGLNLVHADVDNDGQLDVLILRGAWAGERGRIRNSLLLNRVREGKGFVDATYAAGLAQPAAPTQAAAFADFDLDGDLDLYIGNESSVGSTAVQSIVAGGVRPYASQLFENRLGSDGSVRFRDIARPAGVQNFGFAKGVAWGDIDNDGDEDLFVSNIGVNRLYMNLGSGRFRDVAKDWGVADPAQNFAAWFFDFDNDGDLDLFNADYTARTEEVAASLVGQSVETGHPRLYRNEGDRFTDVSKEVGFLVPLLPMGANFGDLDGDGFLDIVLGTGVPDFTAVHPNFVYRNVGGERFDNVTADSGMGHLQKGHAVAFGDLDHDGDLDVFEQLGGAFPYDAYGNALYLNPGNDDQASGGTPAHRFLTLELQGTRANRAAIGARVAVEVESASGTVQTIHRTVSSGGSFGGSSLRLEVGLGRTSKIRKVSIRWPGASKATVLAGELFDLDQGYRVIEASSDEANDRVEPLSLTRFRFKPKSGTASTHLDHP